MHFASPSAQAAQYDKSQAGAEKGSEEKKEAAPSEIASIGLSGCESLLLSSTRSRAFIRAQCGARGAARGNCALLSRG